MKNKLKNQKGITLIALGITIIVLLILASITITASTEAIKRANLEALKTNMLLVQAKAKEYIENAAFELGTSPNEETRAKAKQELSGTTDLGENKLIEDESKRSELGIPQDYEYIYAVSTEALNAMGIKDAKSDADNGYYVVAYNLEPTNEMDVEIYNTQGYNGAYSLSDIEKVEI